MKKTLLIMLICMAFLPSLLIAKDQDEVLKRSVGENQFFSITVPKYWSQYEKDITTYSGVVKKTIFLTPTSEIYNRTSRFFYFETGTPEAIFGLSHKVVEKVTKEQLVDFYLDQEINYSIDYVITKTSIRNVGADTVYIVESTSRVPGPYHLITKDFFEFKNEKVYHWVSSYFSIFANTAPTLQSIADSVVIQ